MKPGFRCRVREREGLKGNREQEEIDSSEIDKFIVTTRLREYERVNILPCYLRDSVDKFGTYRVGKHAFVVEPSLRMMVGVDQLQRD
jgi:hypothetical protein